MAGSKKKASSYVVHLKSIGCTFVIVYVLWSAKEIARLSNDIDALRKTGIHVSNKESSSIHSEYTNNEFSNNQQRIRRSTEKGKPCKREKKYLKKCRRKLRDLSKQGAEQMQAVQLTMDFRVNSTMRQKLYTSTDKCFYEYGGLVCYNNKTYQSSYTDPESNILGVPWKSLTPTDWSPLSNTTKHGEFRIKHDGMYLLYINILIIPTQREERAGIFIDDKQIMSCQDGLTVDQVIEIGNKPQNFTEKSCSAVGVFLLNKDQILSIRLVTQDTKIRLWDVGNNIGAILLRKK